MATAPVYAATPRRECQIIGTANPNRDGTGTTATVFTAGANGSRIEAIAIKALVTNTAGTVRLYLTNGASKRLWYEQAVAALTVSATVPSNSFYLNSLANSDLLPLVLPSGWLLEVSTEKAENFLIHADGADF
jgi:hypothetical protein